MAWGIVNSGAGAGGGGIAPGNMKAFTASSEKGKAKLTCTLPDDTVVEGMLLVTVAGAKILRRTDRFPETEYDGVLVKDLKQSGTFVDQATEVGTTYYYAAFPYSEQNVYNRNAANQAQVTVKMRQYLYGYDIKVADSNPETRVSYPPDVDNAGFARAHMDFSAGKFIPGGWNLTAGHHFMPRPCMLGYDGKVKEWLDPTDYSKQTNGQPSHVSDSGFAGNAMMQWPKIYTKRWEENGTYRFRCSDQKEAEDWDCWCNYDRNDKEIPYFYTPIYFGSLVGDRLRSLSGKAGLNSKTAQQEIDYAKANGADWYTEMIADRMLITDLLVLLAKSTDSRKAYGNGRFSSSAAILSGSMDKSGIFWGSNKNASGVKCFGMENYWGNMWRRIAGWIMVDGVQKIKITRGSHDGTVSEYTTTGKGYMDSGTPTPSGASGGCISTMKTTPYGRVPYKADGSTSTYEANAFWYKTSGTMYAVVGGSCNDEANIGIFCTFLAKDSLGKGTEIGAALSCKPTLEV